MYRHTSLMGLSEFCRGILAIQRNVHTHSLSTTRSHSCAAVISSAVHITVHSSRKAALLAVARARLSSNASIMANVLQIADALYAEDRDAKTLAQRVALN